jgi:hypothetical protein
MQLLIRGFADARACRARVGNQFVQSLRGERCTRIECEFVEGAFDVSELRLESGEWFAEETDGLEQPYDIRADPGRRTKVHDLHRNAPSDAIESADPLLDDRRLPRHVEEHQSLAELKVASLTARFRRYQQAWALRFSESRDFQIALCG